MPFRPRFFSVLHAIATSTVAHSCATADHALVGHRKSAYKQKHPCCVFSPPHTTQSCAQKNQAAVCFYLPANQLSACRPVQVSKRTLLAHVLLHVHCLMQQQSFCDQVENNPADIEKNPIAYATQPYSGATSGAITQTASASPPSSHSQRIACTPSGPFWVATGHPNPSWQPSTHHSPLTQPLHANTVQVCRIQTPAARD